MKTIEDVMNKGRMYANALINSGAYEEAESVYKFLRMKTELSYCQEQHARDLFRQGRLLKAMNMIVDSINSLPPEERNIRNEELTELIKEIGQNPEYHKQVEQSVESMWPKRRSLLSRIFLGS